MCFEKIFARSRVKKKAKMPEIKIAPKMINRLLSDRISRSLETATADPVLDFWIV